MSWATTSTWKAREDSALWSPQRRLTTIGLVLMVTMIAFEAMSIGTALPTMVAELDGESLYSWPFTAFLAASVIGTVLSGRLSDTRGPRLPLLGGPAVFAAGLLVAAVAPTMAVLLVGRVLQGLGAGVAVVVMYVLVAHVYPERHRPAAFGAVSAAWVLPAIVGPAVAGLLTEHASWRLVFGGLAPLTALATALLLPLARRLPSRPAHHADPGDLTDPMGRADLIGVTDPADPAGPAAPGGVPDPTDPAGPAEVDGPTNPAGSRRPVEPERPVDSAAPAGGSGPRRAVLLASVGAAVGLSALTWAAQNPSGADSALVVLLAAAGLVVLVPSLRRVLPARTVTAGRGLPTVVLSRGLLTGSFFAVQAYLPLTLMAVHGLSPTLAGLPLTVGALGWSAASAWQVRRPDVARDRLLRHGFLLLAVGLAATTLVAFEHVPHWVVLPVWVVAGTGMGLAMPSLSVLLLELSPPQDRGFNSAALQIWDMLMAAACIGLGGALLVAIASTERPAPAVIVLNVVMVGVALLGAALASRTGTRSDGYPG